MSCRAMNRLNPFSAALLALLVLMHLGFSAPVRAYDAEIHQQLTFIAARQLNRCMQADSRVPLLSALETRYIAKANVAQADPNVFVRMFRWPYYNRADQTNRSTLGVIDTRFHDHFKALLRDMEEANSRRQQLRELGRVINYVQDVSSPAHAVPVYTGRWWRLSMGDRFDRYRLRSERVESAAQSLCGALLPKPVSLSAVLADAAQETIHAVQGPITGFPATWESYWQLAQNEDEFGEYGRAGNLFGERTEFRCGAEERCLLLENDPLYEEFAQQRHVSAVLATMRAMYLFQAATLVSDEVNSVSSGTAQNR